MDLPGTFSPMWSDTVDSGYCQPRSFSSLLTVGGELDHWEECAADCYQGNRCGATVY